MKKAVFFLPALFLIQTSLGQTTELPQNEIKFNIANTIAIASLELGYENFIDYNQSLEAGILFNDRMNYHTENDSEKFNTTSFKLGYNFYFGHETQGSGTYVNPFLKYRTGDFEEDVNVQDEVIRRVTNMDGFMIGIGGGYKWNLSDSFVLGPFLNIARNFSEDVKERFSALEFNAGFNLGYRF